MARINPQNIDDTDVHANKQMINITTPQIVVSNVPVFVASVNRKMNTGSFESLDIAAAISIPMPQALDADIELLRRIVEETAAEAYSLVSQEVNSRYEKLKALRSTNPRPQG